MRYNEYINLILRPDPLPKFLAVDLFAGCGGLSLGFEAAGFETLAFEKNIDACETYNFNLLGDCQCNNLTLDYQFPKADVVIAGPPCQPFSVNGNQLGNRDSRNGFPICISAIEQISPEIFVIENVKGLLGKSRWYLDFVVEQLQSLDYYVTVTLLNAKHFLVPQNRERVFIMGCKKKPLKLEKSFEQLVTAGDALQEMAFQHDKDSKYLTIEMEKYIKKYEIASHCKVSRDLHLDRPSRTLTCRNLGGSTGDMLRVSLPNGRRRRIRTVESARLQSFPDWFEFKGSENSIFKQIGNSVPPMMAHFVANLIKENL